MSLNGTRSRKIVALWSHTRVTRFTYLGLLDFVTVITPGTGCSITSTATVSTTDIGV
jgi:uncharacterized membrane protein